MMRDRHARFPRAALADRDTWRAAGALADRDDSASADTNSSGALSRHRSLQNPSTYTGTADGPFQGALHVGLSCCGVVRPELQRTTKDRQFFDVIRSKENRNETIWRLNRFEFAWRLFGANLRCLAANAAIYRLRRRRARVCGHVEKKRVYGGRGQAELAVGQESARQESAAQREIPGRRQQSGLRHHRGQSDHFDVAPVQPAAG
eukprot:scaffold1744_cov252-Pinguiococcus_pyrenoidosus.AAC.4